MIVIEIRIKDMKSTLDPNLNFKSLKTVSEKDFAIYKFLGSNLSELNSL